jgi:SAM-dependent methyltransferase
VAGRGPTRPAPACHFGADSLRLAQGGATVVGLDFSTSPIAAAHRLAGELGLADRARFVHADLYDAPTVIAEFGLFDIVYVTWDAICWLPDIHRWAEIVGQFLKPGGSLYLAEAHPAAMVFDDAAALPDGRPGYFVPYFGRAPVVIEETRDYVDETQTLANSTAYVWVHPLSDIIQALLQAEMRLDWLHEHDGVPCTSSRCSCAGPTDYGAGLPLAFSLRVTRRWLPARSAPHADPPRKRGEGETNCGPPPFNAYDPHPGPPPRWGGSALATAS